VGVAICHQAKPAIRHQAKPAIRHQRSRHQAKPKFASAKSP
jgi:hypothetical protein